jgi:hypothetical protein
MDVYRVREVRYVDSGTGSVTLKPLREYEREASDTKSIVEQVRRFFEMEISSPKALLTVDFDALIIVDSKDVEIARFGVSDYWMREWREVAKGVAGA